MARVEIWETLIDGSGRPFDGNISVTLARTLDPATVYAAEEGGGVLTQPFATENGMIPGWVDEGEYDLYYTGTGINPGGPIRFNAIVGGNPQLAPDQVTETELAADSVGPDQIQPGAVGESELAADSVGTSELQDNAVGTAQLQDDAVTQAELADNAVGTAQLQDDAVTQAELADDSVGSAQIAANAVGASEIAAGAVGHSEINDGVLQMKRVSVPNMTIASVATILSQTASQVGVWVTEADTTALINWTTPFSDANYTVVISLDAANDVLHAIAIHD